MHTLTMTTDHAGLQANAGLEATVPTAPRSNTSKKMVWAGRIISALPAALLLSGGVTGLLKPAFVTEGFAHMGYPESLALSIGILELACALLYVIPRTSILGAILLTGYLGGATATHVRIGEPFFAPVVVGALVWAGLYLRDRRLRALIPLGSR
jgi:DoxX-like family